MFRAVAVQMASGTNIRANLSEAEKHIHKASEAGAKLVVLPENFAFMGMHDSDQLEIAEIEAEGPVQAFLSEQAKKHAIWLVGGTLPLKSEDTGKVYSACLVFNDKGEQVARYNKIHLFDVSLAEHNETYHESEYVMAGDTPLLVETPFARIGVAICYDLRFPELFRRLVNMGAEVIVVPSAFTAITGAAHWEVLLRARAIENLSYIVAADQGGYHVNGRETHGDSMIVNPWGDILQRLEHGTGVVTAEIDIDSLKHLRQTFPVLEHRKMICTLHKE